MPNMDLEKRFDRKYSISVKKSGGNFTDTILSTRRLSGVKVDVTMIANLFVYNFSCRLRYSFQGRLQGSPIEATVGVRYSRLDKTWTSAKCGNSPTSTNTD